MSDLPLRAACIHGRYETHQISQYPWGNGPPVDDLCPGGREVIIDPLLEYIAGGTKAYPESVFPQPPLGKHGESVDACSAAMARHVFGRLDELAAAIRDVAAGHPC